MADTLPGTLGLLLRAAKERLAASGVDSPELDARLIVEHFTGTDRAHAISMPNRAVGQAVVAAVDAALKRRRAGEPVHRILGFREFYGLRLALSAETLEPRPDTEILVDALLPFMRETAAQQGICRVLDLGTGAGAIALAILAEVENAIAVGSDISDDALATAARNAEQLGLASRFTAIKSDWFAEISGSYHAIAANPPYIPTQELESLQAEVRNFDPARALDGGPDGLDPYRIIARDARKHLEQAGRVAVESGHKQRRDVTELFLENGYKLLEARRDLSGNDRVLVFRLLADA